MQNQLEHLIGRMEKAMAMPPEQQKRYAMAIAQLEREIEAARLAGGMDEDAVTAKVCAILLSAPDTNRINWPAAQQALDKINIAYASGSGAAMDLALQELMRTMGEGI